MHLFDVRVRPEAGGVVLANTRYGERGALIRRVELEIKAAGPVGIDTVTLTTRVAIHFGIDRQTRQDLFRVRKDTVGWVVRYLKSKGLVEALHASRGSHAPSVWCSTRPPSLDELAQLAALPFRP